MDKLKQLESFVSVVTRGSLTAAAHAEALGWGFRVFRTHAIVAPGQPL